ncbi:MAG: UDP-3-O-(3-hydroxymyristoyl)glucosamine N-acyltransferase, partial [Inquilinus sp.]|nr:UDP-3-O-(3-hydroxymyristoyl)glucosamine N-acyltransferase [Inquilinus sp.]
MADPRFFSKAGPFDLADLAGIAGADLASDGDGGRAFADVAPLDRAGPDTVSFLDNRKYVDAFRASAAGACVAHPDMARHAPAGMALLLTPTPYKAFAHIARAFYPRPAAVPGIAAGAVVDPAALVDPTAEIGAGAVGGARAEIGAHCRIGPNAVIGAGVVV